MSRHCAADNLFSAHIPANVSVLKPEIILNYIKILSRSTINTHILPFRLKKNSLKVAEGNCRCLL